MTGRISTTPHQWPKAWAHRGLPGGGSWCVWFSVIAYITAPWVKLHALKKWEACASLCVCVCSHRDEWRDRCGQCQSDSLASVSPGDPEGPSGWIRWTACCGDRRRTIKSRGQTDQASGAGWLPPILSNDPKHKKKKKRKKVQHTHTGTFLLFWAGAGDNRDLSTDPEELAWDELCEQLLR